MPKSNLIFDNNEWDYLNPPHLNLFILNPERVHHYYLENWEQLSGNMLNYLDKYGTGCETLTLNEFIQLASKPEMKEGFKLLMKSDLASFNYVLNHHSLDKKSITLIIQVLNLLWHTNNEPLIEKFLLVNQKINTHFPQLNDYLSESIENIRRLDVREAVKNIVEKEKLEKNLFSHQSNLKKIKI